MTERITRGYKRLFEILLLHHYWLDDGATVFDLIEEAEEKDRLLLSYDRRSFLALAPTPATARSLQGVGGVYKDTALGGVVAVPATAVIPLETSFTFVVTVLDAAFFNYTVLTLRSRKVYELFHQPSNTLYRYKENVPVLSNLTGVLKGTGANQRFFLSQDFPDVGSVSNEKVEALFQENDKLFQLTGDQPDAHREQIGETLDGPPLYVHQGDMPEITPPVGLTDVPARGVLLSDDLPNDLFALIRLTAVRDDVPDFGFLTDDGLAKDAPPVYQVRFKNRLTIRRYINRKTSEKNDTAPLPLTYAGNAGEKQKPDTGLITIEKQNGKVLKLVSEIYV